MSISIIPTTLNPASAGVPFSQGLTASGGTAPYAWSVSTGALPAGLTLDGNLGTIEGTVNAAGSTTFTITATDSTAATGSQALTLVVEDVIIVSWSRPAQNQSGQVIIPAALVTMLDWLVQTQQNPDGSPAYMYALNVLWVGVITRLLPYWLGMYTAGTVAPLQAQLSTATANIQAAVAAGVSAMVVTGPTS